MARLVLGLLDMFLETFLKVISALRLLVLI
jgi:hypothetical protein